MTDEQLKKKMSQMISDEELALNLQQSLLLDEEERQKKYRRQQRSARRELQARGRYDSEGGGNDAGSEDSDDLAEMGPDPIDELAKQVDELADKTKKKLGEFGGGTTSPSLFFSYFLIN